VAASPADQEEEDFPEIQEEQPQGCVFIIVKGARKGQTCGEKIGKAFQDVKLCSVHGKKK
jgi:hypothetical protein